MCVRSLFCVAAVCSAAFCCFCRAKEVPENPAVFASLEKWSVESWNQGDGSPREKALNLQLNIWEKAGWKVAYLEEGKCRLRLADAKGSSTSQVELNSFYYYSSNMEKSHRPFFFRTKSWVPSRGSGWVEIKGELHLALFRESVLSDRVRVRLVPGFSTSWALKGAAPDGSDVEATLKVKECAASDGEEREVDVELELSSSKGCGFRSLVTWAADGSPLTLTDVLLNMGEHGWKTSFSVEGAEGSELDVSVRYAVGLRKAVVPVKARFGFFGVKEGVNP